MPGCKTKARKIEVHTFGNKGDAERFIKSLSLTLATRKLQSVIELDTESVGGREGLPDAEGNVPTKVIATIQGDLSLLALGLKFPTRGGRG